MARRRLLWKIYPAFLAGILLCVLGVGASAVYLLRELGVSQIESELKCRAEMVEQELRDHPTENPADLARHLGGVADESRLTIIDPDGKVLGDSVAQGEMENHADRPEFHQALSGQPGVSRRYSYTLQQEMLYVAVPWRQDGRIVGAVRASLPLTKVKEAMRSIYIGIGLSGLGMAVLAAAMAMLIGQWVTRPLRQMREGAKNFAAGKLDHRLPPGGTDEFATLADTMNSMAAQLEDKINSLEEYRALQETVLSTMAEGVLTVDMQERIVTVNGSAARIIAVRPEEASGKMLQEVCRNVALERLVRNVLHSRQTAEGEIVLRDASGEHFLQARCSLLSPPSGKPMGVLVVLADLTGIRRLENMRRDFVANVSHELRTPITSIKGFVETLRDGAKSDPHDLDRFLEIIARQSDRLNSIIEDLLSLSRLERQGDSPPIERVETAVRGVLEAAAADVAEKAAAKGVRIALTCPPDGRCSFNPRLLEQAVVNLLDNAIKYSPRGAEVELTAAVGPAGLDVRVKDHGCGIESAHLGRIFERFYRVDKARSRAEGGTGLGLAIVKHIAQAHGGSASVESAPGQGSTFTIHLP